ELERGRTKNIQLLEDIRQAAGPLPLSTLDPSLVAIGLLSRGLLGVVHAELNLSYREAARQRDAVPTLGLIEELHGHMRQLLLDGERKLHAALLAAAPAAVLIEQARSFA